MTAKKIFVLGDLQSYNTYRQIEKSVLPEISKKIEELAISTDNNQTYIRETVENLFEFQYAYANLKNDKELMELVYIKRATGYLYSPEEKIRFVGITVLSQKGKISDIKHLEKIANNSKEKDELRQLASYAIESIKKIPNLK